jgi:hypothetical protein
MTDMLKFTGEKRMSLAWEVSVDDIGIVLKAHNIEYDMERLDKLMDALDHEAIESGVLYYTNFDNQCESALDDIENQLMESGVIPQGKKKFHAPDDDDDWDDDDQ